MSQMNFSAEGFVTKNADVRFTQAGQRITSFSIAVNYGKDEKKTAHYFDCCVWDYDQEINRGMLLKMNGYVKTDKWQNKEGKNQSKVVFVAKELEVIPVNSRINNGANTTKATLESMGEVVQNAPEFESQSEAFDSSQIPF
jgi:single-stranded DNA-binding protein